MDLIPCSIHLPDVTDTRQRNGRYGAGVYLLANDQDYLGVGYLARGAEGLEWRLLDGRTLSASEVTRWDYLPDVESMLRRVKDEELFDEYGYPSDYALARVQTWSWTDPLGWMRFIERLWHQREYAFHIEHSGKSWTAHVSTIGWSGNESIISAMKRNSLLWGSLWVSSRRGGHYVFKDEEAEASAAS